jgi:thiamine-phosphate pyrophosphorylase
MTHDERARRFKAGDLYVVITGEFCAGRSPLAVLDAVLEAGVTLVQCREKRLDDGVYFDLAREFRYRTAAARALLIVDDRLDIALGVEADGVHLGRMDLPIAAARQLTPQLLIGASTHSLDQALDAEREGASYVNLGPIFPTKTKTRTAAPLGPSAIAEIAPRLSVPFTCMGGIKPENIEEVLSRGARHPAVVTAVTAAADPRAAAAALRDSILAARGLSKSRV